MRRLTVVVGTRPECIKLAPLVQQLKARGVPLTVIHTGQHQDLWKGSGLEPDVILPARDPNDPSDILDDHLLGRFWGQTVLVQGDTETAATAAWAAEANEATLVHLEAGVRSGDLANPHPEEGYRIAIDRDAHYAFCATDANLDNLALEGFKGLAWVTGNTGVDACLAKQRPVPVHHRHNTVLVTLHRRESWGEPMRQIVEGILRVAGQRPELSFHFPLHPNNALRDALGGHGALPGGPSSEVNCLRLGPNLKAGPPLAYGTFLNKLAHAQCVVTDSGGVQEDACTLGIPCVVAREVTDRPESVASGHALVAGRTAEGVQEALERTLGGLLRTDPAPIFGDGQSAPRIADLLIQHVLQDVAAAA